MRTTPPVILTILDGWGYRADQIAKYNQPLHIEEEFGQTALYLGGASVDCRD
jgi:enolase